MTGSFFFFFYVFQVLIGISGVLAAILFRRHHARRHVGSPDA